MNEDGATSKAGSAARAFELKGTVSTLTVLRLLDDRLERIGDELAARVAQLPHFFHHAPVVVDVDVLAEQGRMVAFDRLAALLREHKLVPVAVRFAPADVAQEAAAAGFGLLKGAPATTRGAQAETAATATTAPAESASPSAPASPAAESASTTATDDASKPAATAAEVPPPALALPGLVVSNPVRAGQVVYAQQRDLVVLASVNAGAELIADGHIHVYGPLRGRALAGAHGNEDARIFCESLDAELVAVAGQYLTSDQLPPDARGKACQVSLKSDQLLIDTIKRS